MMFDTGPEEDAWERNARRLHVDLASIERIQLSHWHRDHSGGMLRAVKLITEAKKTSSVLSEPVVVDLHPSRPDYRGFVVDTKTISMQADPSFSEIKAAGGVVDKQSEPHTVLDDMFLVSGEIPRITPYETGLRGGLRFEGSTGKWEVDETISDERFLMCNLKGENNLNQKKPLILISCKARALLCSRVAVTEELSMPRRIQ
jgi:7,8-dihydropterin-6-yl-methyl-4-(beta-D-ribofuranosyl)aminobenzene 5'-phosphate synthase